jgi:transcription initiation factor TFIID subunit 6
MSLFPPEVVKIIAEGCGIKSLKDNVASALSQDVEYRLFEIVQDAIKFMNHSKRTKLTVDDVNHALRNRNIEPIYGYQAAYHVPFRRAISTNHDVYFVDDEEIDLEKLLATPLPPAPRPVVYTAHWLAVEGVQPALPQNPIPAEAKKEPLTSTVPVEAAVVPPTAGGVVTPMDAAVSSVRGMDVVADDVQPVDPALTVKPIVKHHLSYEMYTYFNKVTSALLNESDQEAKQAALQSIGRDPGLYQLVPYLVQFICDQVSTNLRKLVTMTTILAATRNLLHNPSLYMDPYLHQVMPPILTCLLAKRIGSGVWDKHWELRNAAAYLLGEICNKYARAYHSLKPRITRTLLHAFLDPSKSYSTHYGALVGLQALGPEVIKSLVFPNLKAYETIAEQIHVRDASDMDIIHERRFTLNAIKACIHTVLISETQGDPMEQDMTDDLRRKILESFGMHVGGTIIEVVKNAKQAELFLNLDK